MPECPICIESYNKSTRCEIDCTKCDFVCCKTCFKRYITDPDHYLICMSCSVEFDRASLQARVGKGFMQTTYRNIREIVLYEQERALFAATQEIIEHKLKIRSLQKQLSNIDEDYENIRKQRTVPLKEFRYSTEIMTVSEAIDKYLQLALNVDLVDEQLHDARKNLQTEIEDLEGSSSKLKRTYILPCTTTSCKGMLSSENTNEQGHYKCSICDSSTCDKCKMAVQNISHQCDPDVLKSLQYLESTSKPCPSCGIPIHKTSGCSQMFCTSCHASFDWNTLRLNNGTVHNPYHATWLRENHGRSREVGDIQCGRELDIDIAVRLAGHFEKALRQENKVSTQTTAESNYLFESIRVGIHHTHVTLVSLARNRNGHHTNQSLRVRLLMNEMTEDDFKKEIQRRDKSASKRNDYLHIVQTYRDSITDIIWPFVEAISMRRKKRVEEWVGMIGQIHSLETYVNECFIRVALTYGSAYPYEIMDDRAIR